MGKGIILWLLGVPVSLIALLWFWVFYGDMRLRLGLFQWIASPRSLHSL